LIAALKSHIAWTLFNTMNSIVSKSWFQVISNFNKGRHFNIRIITTTKTHW
jgi:hypothetical protein